MTLADLVKKLEEEYGIPSAAADVRWKGEDETARMKELGNWDAEIVPKGGETPVSLQVEVTRLE